MAPLNAMSRLRRSLQRRLMTSIVIVALFFAGIGSVLAYATSRLRAEALARDALTSLVDAVEQTMAIGAYAGDQVLLQEVVDGLLRHPLVAQAHVKGSDGSALVLRTQRLGRPAATPDARVEIARWVLSPFDPRERVGQMTVIASADQVAALARGEAIRLSLYLLVLTVLVALTVFWVAQRVVSGPLLNVARHLSQVRPGSRERVPAQAGHESDEIGSLVGSANGLLAQTEIALAREREARAEVEAMEARYRQIFHTSSAGIIMFDDEGCLVHCNAAAQRLAAWTDGQIAGLKGGGVVEALFTHPERVQAGVQRAAATGDLIEADFEVKGGAEVQRWAHCLLSTSEPSPGQRLVEAVLYDVTERRRRESAIRHTAEHDNLTGLKNRAAMEAAIDHRVAAGLADSTVRWCVLGVDLDGFKQINDRLGHLTGDRVLVEVASRMRAEVRRSSDIVARMGGDEFLVLLDNVDAGDLRASEVASALLVALQKPIVLDSGESVAVGASIGMASFPRHGRSRDTLLQAADLAMYEVKRSGKNAFAQAVAPAP